MCAEYDPIASTVEHFFFPCIDNNDDDDGAEYPNRSLRDGEDGDKVRGAFFFGLLINDDDDCDCKGSCDGGGHDDDDDDDDNDDDCG